ncbi:MAG: hypothetical protein ACRCUE_19825 [Bosea sp. (in: a-proteobacteria)]
MFYPGVQAQVAAQSKSFQNAEKLSNKPERVQNGCFPVIPPRIDPGKRPAASGREAAVRLHSQTWDGQHAHGPTHGVLSPLLAFLPFLSIGSKRKRDPKTVTVVVARAVR